MAKQQPAAVPTSGSTIGLSPDILNAARKDLQAFVAAGNLEPDRGDLSDDSAISWRQGRPNYTLANVAFFKGRTRLHPAGSLELLVENLVKTWEMEASHKPHLEQWTSIDPSKYAVQANGGRLLSGEEAAAMGNYNALMEGCPKHLYDSEKESFESSHVLFRSAFPEGFPWEVLEVFSGPPKVAFQWRYWAKFSGNYKNVQGNGQTVEMHGFCIAEVNDSLKVIKLEVYYKPDEFLKMLEAGGKPNRSLL